MGELKNTFRPEFINRLDEIIVFHSLEKEHIKKIVRLMTEQLKKRVEEHGISIEITDAALDKIADEGFDPEYGARPLRRALQRHVEDRLSDELLKGTLKEGNTAVIDVKDNEFIVETKTGTAKAQ
jgi:ATP-dependent Clp protease ATP-binding subunit ClpC